MRNEKPIIRRNFSRGVVRTAQDSVVAASSCKLALNLSSTEEIGSLVTRKGTSLVGEVSGGLTCYGLHYHRDTVATNHIIFGVFSDGVNNIIYDMSDGSTSLSGDTKELKTRFATFLNSTVRVNGVDAAKSFNGSAWVSTGGAFDEDNMPLGNVVIEWKDQVYTAGVAASPNILYYSSIADPDSRTIYWTPDETETGPGDIEIEQEDGSGAITALEKVPGYLLVFRERGLKRWDGASTFPEDLIGIGCPSQEAVCRGRGMVFFGNDEGFWATNGSYPQLISKPIQDLWDAITNDPITYCDEKFVYVYVGDITLNGNLYSNILFKYNIDDQTWDIYSYYNEFTAFTWTIVSDKKEMIGGDKLGHTLQLNSGYTDYHSTVQPITYSMETQDVDFGRRGRVKEIIEMDTYTENIKLGQLMYRSNSNKDEDWKSLGNITNDVENISNFKAKGNWFNFKITGITDSGQVKILGYEFPEGSISTTLNTKE